jgi:hypothetical protein
MTDAILLNHMKLARLPGLQLGRLNPMQHSTYSAGHVIVTTVRTSDSLAGKWQSVLLFLQVHQFPGCCPSVQKQMSC